VRIKNLRLAVLFLLTVCQVVRAEEIRGTVADPSGALIPGAAIRLAMGDRVIATATTDAMGAYSLHVKHEKLSSTAALRVEASAPGFAPATFRVEFVKTTHVTLPIRMQIAASPESVTVEAKSPPFRDQLDMSDVRDSSAKDIGEALSQLDGISKLRRGGIANDLVVRGLQRNNINVLVDGSRTYGACPGGMDPPAQHVDFSEVERVEVLKGPYDVANQGSLGAIINVVTKSPGPGFHLKPSLSVGSSAFFNPSITASYGTDSVKLLLGYSFRNADPYKDGLGKTFTSYANYTAKVQNRKSFDIHSGWFQSEFAPTTNQKVSLSYTRQVSGLVLYPYLTMDADYDRADRVIVKYQIRDFSRDLHAVRIESYFTQVQHYMSDRLRATALAPSWKMASDASTRVIGGRVETDFGRDFTFGFESYYRKWNMLQFANMGAAINTGNAIPDVTTTTAGAFVDYHHAFSDTIRLNGGFRFDHAAMDVGVPNFNSDMFYLYQNTRNTSNTDNYPSGNLRLTMGAFKHLELFVGAGSTARIPDAEERYINRKTAMGANVGNPLLPSTRNTEVDAGFKFTRGRAYVKPSLFFSNLSDYIIVNDQPKLNAQTSGPMLPATARSYQNIGARIYGGEVSYAVALPAAFSLSGGASYSRGIGNREPQFGILSTNLPEMPPLHSWAALRYTHATAFAEIGGAAAGRQNLIDRDLHETPTPGYGLMNLKLGCIYKKWYGSFMMDNLLNRFYYEHLSYYRDPDFSGVKVPEPGRNFFAQVKYTF